MKKGLNFAVTPKKVPIVDMITVTESACRNLDKGDTSELRSKVCGIVDKYKKIKDQNVTKEEIEGIERLKKDDSIMVLPADKVRVTVVLNKTEYDEKCQQLLGDQKTYKKLKETRPENSRQR